MKNAESPLAEVADETARNPTRLEALRETNLLDSPPEPVFDRLTKFAATVLRVPVAIMTLIDRDRQFFKSHCGLSGTMAEDRENPLSYSFCKYVVASGEPLLIPDARVDPLVQNNPAVFEHGVVAYIGVPLVTETGQRLGTLCAFDTKIRQWSQEDTEVLRAVAAQIMTEVELRTKTQALGGYLDEVRELEQNRRSMTRMTVHDLRTPLSSLLLCLEMLPILGALNPAQTEYVGICARAGENLRAIVDSLLDIEAVAMRGQAALSKALCDPRKVAERALEQVVGLVTDSKMTIVRDFPDQLPLVQADPDKLERVLVNLLGNAIKFSSAGSKVTVKAEVERNGSENLVFSVSDTGLGISEADTEKIFDEGVILNSKSLTRASTGLGLTYCKRIVDAHEGKIWVRSELKKGSTFFVALPISPDQTKNSAA